MAARRFKVVTYRSAEWQALVDAGWTTLTVDGSDAVMASRTRTPRGWGAIEAGHEVTQ